MSSKKKSAKKQYKKKRRKYTGFRSQMQRDGLFYDKKLVYEPKGKDKMSEIFIKFAEPYIELVETEEGYNNLFAVAMIAWNASFLDNIDQRKMISEYKNIFPLGFRKDFVNIVNVLIERKNKHFSENDRKILSYKIIDLGDDINVQVASTM